MEYGVFQIDEENKLVLRARFTSEEEALHFVKTGINMVILRIYM